MSQVKNYELKARNGKHIKIGTKVIFGDGLEMNFMEKISKKKALRQAYEYRRKLDVKWQDLGMPQPAK